MQQRRKEKREGIATFIFIFLARSFFGGCGGKTKKNIGPTTGIGPEILCLPYAIFVMTKIGPLQADISKNWVLTRFYYK